MKGSLLDILERQELIQKLIDKGHGELIEIFLMNENKVYTKKGRLNKSGACRALGCKPKDLQKKLDACREILKNEFLSEN